MLLKLFLVGAVVAGLMIGVKEHRLLERLHVTGSCSTLAVAKDGTEWRTCTAGNLSGKPSLANDGCTDSGARGSAELWHCPASLASNISGQ
ncbi:MAG: hypothetical protein ACYDA3_02650 [Gaiellaceae bacterium]